MALTDNLVAYYKLDETSGTTVYDALGVYNGTNNGVTVNQAGKIDKAYLFDNSTDNINFGDVHDFIGAGSISFWYKTRGSLRDANCVMNKNKSGVYSGWAVNMNEVSGNIEFSNFYSGSGHAVKANNSFSTNTWYHIVIVKGTTSQNAIYVNGVSKALTTNQDTTGDSSNNYAFTFGKNPEHSVYFLGTLDDVAIFSRALSPTEVTKLYNSGDGLTYPFVSIPTVITTGVSNIGTTTATFEGNLTEIGYPNPATEMGFCYNLSGTPTISDNKLTTSPVEGSFSLDATGLTSGAVYYVRAYATNIEGTAYGSQVVFYTKAEAPINFSSVEIHNRTAILSWNRSGGAERTLIRRKEGSYPTSITDGTEVFFDYAETFEDSELTADTTYYYRAWGWDLHSGYSTDYDELTITTLKEYLVETASNDGTINRSDEGYEGYYEEGYNLTLTGTPDENYTFFYWSGDGIQYTNTITKTITSNLSLEGHFVIPEENKLLFPPYGTAISKAISGHNEPIYKATMKVDTLDSFTYYMSIDGETWEEVTPNLEHTFINSGNNIRWKIVENAGVKSEISSVVIEYLRTSAETPRFRGKITRKTNSNDEELTLSGKSIAMITTGINIIYSSVGSKKRSDILKEIIEQYFDGEITTKYIEEDETEMDVNYDEVPFWSVVEEICTAAERDAYIDVDMNFHYFPKESRINEKEAVVENVNLVQTSDYATDTEETYTKVRLYGENSNGVPLIYTTSSDTTNTKGYEKVYKINDNNVKTMAQAKDLAEYTLADLKQMPQIGACKSLLLPNLMPGEKLFIANPQNGINPQLFDIQAYKHLWDDDGVFTELTIKKPRFNTSSILKSNISFQDEITQNTNPENMDFTYLWDFKDDIEGSYSGTYRKEIEFVNVKGVSTCSKGALKTDTTGYWESEDIVFGSNFTKLKLKIGGNNISNVTSQFSVDGGSTWKSFNFSGQASMLSSDTIRVRLVLLTPDVEIFSVGILYSL